MTGKKHQFIRTRCIGQVIPKIEAEDFSTVSSAYTLLTSEADYRHACDTVLGQSGREILIFDRDLTALRLEEPARLEALVRFLQSDSRCGLRVVLHVPEHIENKAPHLMQLIARFSHVIEVRQSPDNLRHLADTHLLIDDVHGVRRFHIDQPRSALILDDPVYLHPWRQRFEELWELSLPYLMINTARL